MISEHPSSLTTRNAETIQAIRENHRQRDDMIRASGNIARQIKSICGRTVGFSAFSEESVRKEKSKEAAELLLELKAGGPALGVQISAGHLLPIGKEMDRCQREIEKILVSHVKKVGIGDFVDSVKGLGYIGIGQIIGEAGDLSNYSNPAKLWKRMGLGIIDGERQRKMTNPDAAMIHGYSPRRRSVMFVIVDSLLKQQNEYRSLFLERKAIEHGKAIAEGLIPATTIAATVTSWTEAGLPAPVKVKKIEPGVHRSASHMNNRAQRYVAKRLLRDLWKAWTNQ